MVNTKLVLLTVFSGILHCHAMENVGELVKPKKIGIFSEINQRKQQEDRFCHCDVDGGNLYAVYDGHLGSEVADFLANNFHEYFRKTSGSIRERMIQTFQNVDNDEVIKKYKHCGAAAAIVFIKDNIAHCAHVGDARIVLESDGSVAFATIDHKPDRADEYVRIEDKKGAQFADSMKDFLILSRSFGDHGFNKDVMIAEPDYKEIELTQECKFLLLGTDGLWSVMSNEEATGILHAQRSQVQDMNLLAKMLGMCAIKKNSKDNITVMLVDLLS
jgi:serine/threonine protein phosphatase PrpC